MLTITVEVNAPAEYAQGVKERIAMDLERYGDVRIVSIKTDSFKPRQMKIGGIQCRRST